MKLDYDKHMKGRRNVTAWGKLVKIATFVVIVDIAYKIIYV